MALIFKNDTSLTLYVAFAHEDQSCGGSKWRKVGWYELAPRGTRTVRTGSTKGNFTTTLRTKTVITYGQEIPTPNSLNMDSLGAGTNPVEDTLE